MFSRTAGAMEKMAIVVLVWTSHWSFTYQGATDFLNSLPEDRALEAKIACDSAACYVFYRSPKDLKVPEEVNR